MRFPFQTCLSLMRTTALVCLSLLAAAGLSAQNLVKNPSFEEGAVCDGSTENIETSNHWKPVAGAPRFLNTACTLNPETRAYVQAMKLPAAYAGNVYAGIGLDAKSELLQGSLTEPLEAGVRYWLRLRLRLPVRFCNQPLSELGVHFSEQELPTGEEMQLLDLPAVALRPLAGKRIDQTMEWQEVNALYTARGGERFLTIGHFAQNIAELPPNRGKEDCSYLFIDAVSVQPYVETSLREFAPDLQNWQAQELVALSGLRFENESLSPEALNRLDELALFLKQQSELRIEIYAHAEADRSEAECLSQTANRAKQIADYLLKKGIAADRLFPVGKGSSQPLAANNEADHSLRNNRIELRRLPN